jgi:hypothetical protein
MEAWGCPEVTTPLLSARQFADWNCAVHLASSGNYSYIDLHEVGVERRLALSDDAMLHIRVELYAGDGEARRAVFSAADATAAAAAAAALAASYVAAADAAARIADDAVVQSATGLPRSTGRSPRPLPPLRASRAPSRARARAPPLPPLRAPRTSAAARETNPCQ